MDMAANTKELTAPTCPYRRIFGACVSCEQMAVIGEGITRNEGPFVWPPIEATTNPSNLGHNTFMITVCYACELSSSCPSPGVPSFEMPKICVCVNP